MFNLHNTRNAEGISLVLQVIYVTIHGHINDGCIHFRTEMTQCSIYTCVIDGTIKVRYLYTIDIKTPHIHT